jgi:cell division protein FtsB
LFAGRHASTLFDTVLPAIFRGPASFVAALLLATLLGASVFGSGGLLQLWKLRAERAALGEEALKLCRANDSLRQKIRRLRRSDRELEVLARRELGLVRDDEIVYRFASRPAGASSVTRPPATRTDRDP